jgi:hypothetical protein
LRKRPALFTLHPVLALLALLMMAGAAAPARAERWLLLPMDLVQRNHLRAYGVAFHTLQAGDKVNWLLNYRGGSFLLKDTQRGAPRCAAAGCRFRGTG